MTPEELSALATPVAWNADTIRKLALWADNTILAPQGVTLESYSTTRLMMGQNQARTQWTWHQPLLPGLHFEIEVLPKSLEYLVLEHGLSLRKQADMDEQQVAAMLRSALHLIEEHSRPLFASVKWLLRSLHVLVSEPEVDRSFSLPELPNSVCLSIPEPDEPDAVPRLSEAIVHEVLHLQLSLVERCTSLVEPGAPTVFIYSPWREEMRPLSGLLHGLFVFRGIQTMWSHVANAHAASTFARTRVHEIEEQCGRVDPQSCKSLTPFGRQVLAVLLTNQIAKRFTQVRHRQRDPHPVQLR